MLSLMSIARHPPLSCFLSFLMVVTPGIIDVLEVSASFVFCIVMMSAL